MCDLNPRLVKTSNSMASLPHESRTFLPYLEFDEDVDHDSDTDVQGDERTLFKSLVTEVRPLSANNPFVERGETTVPLAQHHATDLCAGGRIIAKPLDDQEEFNLQQE